MANTAAQMLKNFGKLVSISLFLISTILNNFSGFISSKVWSPNHNIQLSERIERVQRRATKWILRTGTCEMPYKQRLLKLELLPLSYDREMKDLVYFFKSLYGYVDLNINNCVCFVQNGRTRLSQATGVTLQTPMSCRTAKFQSSYFNRILQPYGTVYVKLSIQINFLALSLSKTFLNADIYNFYAQYMMLNYPVLGPWCLTIPVLENSENKCVF